jgi:hypothetical protein
MLAELGTRIGDEARKHKVVNDLRDLISKVQPFMSKADAKKKLNEALDELGNKGTKKGVMALLEAAFGEAPEKPVDGTVTRKAPGEHILDGPELESPLDKPKPVQRFSFRFEDMPSRVAPSKYFKLKLRVPTDFKPDDKKYGATRVVCQSLADHTTNRGRPPFAIDKRIVDRGDKQGLQSLDLQAPDEPAITCSSSTASRPSRNPSRSSRSASNRAVEHGHGQSEPAGPLSPVCA